MLHVKSWMYGSFALCISGGNGSRTWKQWFFIGNTFQCMSAKHLYTRFAFRICILISMLICSSRNMWITMTGHHPLLQPYEHLNIASCCSVCKRGAVLLSKPNNTPKLVHQTLTNVAPDWTVKFSRNIGRRNLLRRYLRRWLDFTPNAAQAIATRIRHEKEKVLIICSIVGDYLRRAAYLSLSIHNSQCTQKLLKILANLLIRRGYDAFSTTITTNGQSLVLHHHQLSAVTWSLARMFPFIVYKWWSQHLLPQLHRVLFLSALKYNLMLNSAYDILMHTNITWLYLYIDSYVAASQVQFYSQALY